MQAKDLGHTCRECRMPFSAIGEPLTERRGASAHRKRPRAAAQFGSANDRAPHALQLIRTTRPSLASAPTARRRAPRHGLRPGVGLHVLILARIKGPRLDDRW